MLVLLLFTILHTRKRRLSSLLSDLKHLCMCVCIHVVCVHVYAHACGGHEVNDRCFLLLNLELTNSAFLACQQTSGSSLSLLSSIGIAGGCGHAWPHFFYVDFGGIRLRPS